MSHCNRCNWQTQPAEYGFTECFCDLLTPYTNDKEKEKEKKEVQTVNIVKQENDESLLKRSGC
jgi:hypothetical protein